MGISPVCVQITTSAKHLVTRVTCEHPYRAVLGLLMSLITSRLLKVLKEINNLAFLFWAPVILVKKHHVAADVPLYLITGLAVGLNLSQIPLSNMFV